mgnify:CR=1 FL=1
MSTVMASTLQGGEVLDGVDCSRNRAIQKVVIQPSAWISIYNID